MCYRGLSLEFSHDHKPRIDNGFPFTFIIAPIEAYPSYSEKGEIGLREINLTHSLVFDLGEYVGLKERPFEN